MKRRDEETLLEKWRRILKFVDIKGGVIVGLFSLMMLAIIPFYAVKNRNLPSTVRDVYLGVITCFAVNQTAKVIKGQKEEEDEAKV